MEVYYVIPTDGDEFAHPNVFTIRYDKRRNGGRITLEQIRKAFPIKGVYHFRFKMKWKNTYGTYRC